jgi:hypothetical protein
MHNNRSAMSQLGHVWAPSVVSNPGPLTPRFCGITLCANSGPEHSQQNSL